VLHSGGGTLSTISNRDSEFVSSYLAHLQIDNTGIIERKLKPKVWKETLPLARKLLRTTSLPSGLEQQEMKYLERVEWPKSIYKWALLKEGVALYTQIPIGDELKLNYLDQFSHPYRVASVHKSDMTLERNRRSLSKGNSLPNGGSKRDNLPEIKQYVEEKIKPNPILDVMYSIMPGVRTQQSHPDDPKVRLVFGTPGSYWYLECEWIDDAITQTIQNVDTSNNIFVFYTEPSKLQEWVRSNGGGVYQWANLDATNFDSSVTASEIRQMVQYFAPGYEFNDLISEYLIHASLVMPEGDVSRDGGMPSGSKSTNLFDGFCNVLDILESLARYKLDRYVECICVNGDDISVGLSTKLTPENIEKVGNASRRNIHPDKSVLSDYVWNSKWYVDENLMTRPVFRVLNNIMFSERMKSSIYGSKEYIELSVAQQLSDIENHPFGTEIIRSIAGLTKYHISSMPDEQLRPAAEAYINAHSWKEDEDVDSMLSKIRQSVYAQEGS